MSRYTKAYTSFKKRLDEIEVLRKLAGNLETKNALGNKAQIDSICRGATILLCSHVEAYIKELGEVAIERFLKNKVPIKKLSKRFLFHLSKEFVQDVKNTINEDKIANRILKFCEEETDYWNIVGNLNKQVNIEKFNKGFSNPKYDKVRSYLARFGYLEFHKGFQSALKADAEIVRNSLDHLVDICNSIAHGDESASKTPKQVYQMMNDAMIFCRIVDDTFATWCKFTHCTIR